MPSRRRRGAFRTGDRVLARWGGDGRRYYGTIRKRRTDGRFEVAWEDGDPAEVVDRVYPPTDDEDEDEGNSSSDEEWEGSEEEESENSKEEESEDSKEEESKSANQASHLTAVLEELAKHTISFGYNKWNTSVISVLTADSATHTDKPPLSCQKH